MLTPEQARDLVEHFGSKSAAARAIGVPRQTFLRWCDPEASRRGNATYYAAHRDQLRATQQQRRREMSANEREREYAQNREYKRARQDAGLCVTCGSPRLSERYCWDCLNEQSFNKIKRQAEEAGITDGTSI
jgi:hypothetical protein